MKLSIVSTLYRSAPSVAEFHRRAMAAGEAMAEEVELILVDDGSPDDSLERALALREQDPRVVVVELSRNFGHHKAMMTGLAHAQGELVFLIDCDLEEAPELLGKFHALMLAGDWDVVYGVQAIRRGGAFERASGAAFFSIVNVLSDQPVPRNVVTARLMRLDYVRALVAHQDQAFQISHLWAITGFRQTAMEIEKLALSPTTYSLRRRIDMAIKHVTTTSTKLLYLILAFGAGICVLAVLTTGFFIIRYLTHGVGVGGWTSLIVSVWFFGGTTVLILGILGIYIANILAETKHRPYTVIRRVYRPQIEARPRATALSASERVGP
ncbi:MAG: glycosyl transferase [Rubritepida sp.]|nr:glycosyl transferase [Rubritepida sp.]